MASVQHRQRLIQLCWVSRESDPSQLCPAQPRKKEKHVTHSLVLEELTDSTFLIFLVCLHRATSNRCLFVVSPRGCCVSIPLLCSSALFRTRRLCTAERVNKRRQELASGPDDSVDKAPSSRRELERRVRFPGAFFSNTQHDSGPIKIWAHAQDRGVK